MRECPVPVVARVQGLCLAGGIGLATGCDVVLARESAAFGLPEVDRGLWPFMVSALLARHVSPKHAMDRMLVGDRFDAQYGVRDGAGVASLRRRELRRRRRGVRREARCVAAGRGPARQGGLGRGNRDRPSLPVALEAMQAQLSLLTTTKDAAEGIAAFFEKRPPRGPAADRL